MLFKKLRLQNIRSYTDVEVEFPNGRILLAGDIGSGKTSILLGLQFALFGLQPGQKGTSLLRQGEEKAYAQLEIEIDGNTILLERTIKRSKNGSITQDSNTLTIDGERTDMSTSEMKDKVITLLNYPSEFARKSNLLYKFTVYTPQEEMKSIIEERPEIRLDTLRHIFGIDRYKRIKENAHIFSQKLKETIRIKEVLATELTPLKERLHQVTDEKITLARTVNNLELDHKKIIEEIQTTEITVKNAEQQVEEFSKQQAEIEKLHVLLEGKITLENRLKREIELLSLQTKHSINYSPEQLSRVTELLTKHKRILEEKNHTLVHVSETISAIESKKESPLTIQERIASLENCPTCFQRVGTEHKDKLRKRTQFTIEELDRELEQKIIEKTQVTKEVETEKKLITEYETDKQRLEENKIKSEHQRSLLTKMKSDGFVLERTSNEIQDLKETITQLEEQVHKKTSPKKEYETLQETITQLRDTAKTQEITLATKKRELEIKKEFITELQQDIEKKETIKENISHLRSLTDFLNETFIAMIDLTEKNVLAKLRIEFSHIFSEWFSLLVTDNTLTVRLDEDFTPIISNQDYDIEYSFLSGGERTAVALAYRLSLNQVLNSMISLIKTKDIVILDEPTDGFASEQIDKMRDIFDQLTAEQIILVSHEQKMEGFVDYVIKVSKDGKSKVEAG